MGKYDKIIHMKRPLDPNQPPMSMHNRAAQFAPFDALTGFGGRIYEVSRLTDKKIELSEEQKAEINDKMNQLENHIKEHPEITVTYFIPDKTKDGGAYQTLPAIVLKIDAYNERIKFGNDISIAFDDILEIEREIFKTIHG